MSNDSRPRPLLAGVCSALARICHCNVWAIRAVFVLLLMMKTLLVGVVYLVLALLLRVVARERADRHHEERPFTLGSEQLAGRSRRIGELDRLFRDWEDSLRG